MARNRVEARQEKIVQIRDNTNLKNQPGDVLCLILLSVYPVSAILEANFEIIF